jgi:hypothetical protein
MLDKITEYMLIKHVERKLGKYDIKMVHFIPGRIRLQSPRWKMNVALITVVVGSFIFLVFLILCILSNLFGGTLSRRTLKLF